MAGLERITQRADVMGGKPSIRGLRVTVGMIVGQIGAGQSIESILTDYTPSWNYPERRALKRHAGFAPMWARDHSRGPYGFLETSRKPYYPYLEREDVMQALRYAAWLAEEREVVMASRFIIID